MALAARLMVHGESSEGGISPLVDMHLSRTLSVSHNQALMDTSLSPPLSLTGA